MAITSANQLELLQTAEAVAREKMIDPDLVIQAMEESLARAASRNTPHRGARVDALRCCSMRTRFPPSCRPVGPAPCCRPRGRTPSDRRAGGTR